MPSTTHERTAAWNRTLKSLVKISHEFSTVLNLRDLLERVAVLTRQLVRYDALSILLLDSEARLLRNFLSIRHDQRVGVCDVSVDKGIVGAAARKAMPVHVSDTRRDPRYLPAFENIRSSE